MGKLKELMQYPEIMSERIVKRVFSMFFRA